MRSMLDRLLRYTNRTMYDYVRTNMMIDRWNRIHSSNHSYVYYCQSVQKHKECWDKKACMCVPYHKRPIHITNRNTRPDSSSNI